MRPLRVPTFPPAAAGRSVFVDAQQLLKRQLPMPGTLYDERGVPLPRPDHTFPNHLVMAESQEILRKTDPRLAGLSASSASVHDMMALRDLLESLLNAMTRRESRALPREGRIALRRMMAHYWDNNSNIFALDLVGAVIRQGTFVEKMDRIDWLHSPALPATVDRLIRKYGVFFRIMAEHPDRLAVPTLGVDLAWHTHQLTAKRHFAYSTARTQAGGWAAIFIDHDDKVDETRLTQGFEWTSKQYRKLTNGGVYSECTCWYCEAVRETDLSSGLSSIFQSSSVTRARSQADALHSDPNVSHDPDRNAHISAHNVVRVQEPFHIRLHGMQLRSRYLRAYRRAEKRRRRAAGHNLGHTGSSSSSHSTSPADDNIGSGGRGGDRHSCPPIVWGYPYYMPFYAPYMCDPGIHGDTYACNPTCMNLSLGGYGNCISGTCGGGVAAGGCGGKGGICGKISRKSQPGRLKLTPTFTSWWACRVRRKRRKRWLRRRRQRQRWWQWLWRRRRRK